MDNKCYIISYETSTDTDLANLEAAIKEYGTWAKITENTWAIVTTQTAVEVRNNLDGYIASGRLFIVKSGLEAAWKSAICSNKWLKDNL